MKIFKKTLGIGEESRTSEVFVDDNGVCWPIYVKRLDCGAMPNNTTKNVAHGVTDIKIGGLSYFECLSLRADDGTNVWDERNGGTGVRTSITATNLVLVSTTDLSLHVRGVALIAYCKTSDNGGVIT